MSWKDVSDAVIYVCVFSAAGDGCDHVVLTATTPTPSANSNNTTAVSINLHSALIESQSQHQRSSVVAKSTHCFL